MKFRYFLSLKYKGTHYSGWQIQPNAISIQEELQTKLSILLNESINVVGCGRTDTGVHAAFYMLHFDVETKIIGDFVYKINAILPKDIVISNLFEVSTSSHARFHAISRSYQYRITTEKSPFNMDEHFYYNWEPFLELDRFKPINELLINSKEFKTFCKTHSGNKHFKCDIFKIEWIETSKCKYAFNITANRFLRGMIRLIVGMYLNFHRGKLTFEDIEDAIENQSSLSPNWSVPASGLFLSKVIYPDSILKDK